MTVSGLFELLYQNADYDMLARTLEFTPPMKTRSQNIFDILSSVPNIQVKGEASKREPPKEAASLVESQESKKSLNTGMFTQVMLDMKGVSTKIKLDQVFCCKDAFSESRYLQYSCTDSVNRANLVQLKTGELCLVDGYFPPEDIDIVAVLQFHPSDPGLSYQKAIPEPITTPSIDWIDFVRGGFCRYCTELVYVPPIPEGVEVLVGAFEGCIKLNCPIYLPSSIRDCQGMLEGCTAFSSEIYVPDNLDIASVTGLKEYSQYIKRKGG